MVHKREYILTDPVSGDMIRMLRKRLKLSQREFAQFLHVSKPTIERWEGGGAVPSGPIVPLVKLLWESPEIVREMEVPEREGNLRLWYMYKQIVCTIIDVDEPNSKVRIHNYTDRLQYRAFGHIERPTFADYEEFLEGRCFPRGRDKKKIILEELGLPFYDPLMIIKKTQGKMAEDDFWIRVDLG